MRTQGVDASRLCILKTPCRPCRSFHWAKLPQWIGTTKRFWDPAIQHGGFA